MNPNESTTAVTDSPAAESSVKKWLTDSAGRKIYYPYGQSRIGYVVTDAVRENAIRDADRRFEDVSKQIAPYVYLLFLPVTYLFYYFVSSHPVLAYAVYPSAIVLAGVVIWLIRRPTIIRLVAGLDRVPPAHTAGSGPLYRAGYVIGALSGVIALVLHLYDQRVAAVAANSKTMDFYPDISQNLIFACLSALMLLGVLVRWNKVSAKVGPVRAMAAIFIIGILALIQVVQAAKHFNDPQPKIVLSEFTLNCGWSAGWAEITKLSLRSGSRGRQYARIEYTDTPSFAHQTYAQDCEIDGLNADYTEVFNAIQKRRQVLLLGAPAIDSMADKPTLALRALLRQLPLGSSREKVTAILGQPMVTYPSGFGQVQFYPRSQAGETFGMAREAWRVVAVSFDESRRVDRFAVYGLSNGKIVDDISHETLATSNEYYAVLVVSLDPRWSVPERANR